MKLHYAITYGWKIAHRTFSGAKMLEKDHWLIRVGFWMNAARQPRVLEPFLIIELLGHRDEKHEAKIIS
jgi:hypothetical protein